MADHPMKIDPSLFNVERLIAALLLNPAGSNWRQDAEIIPAYMPPFPQPTTRPRVAIRCGKWFLRYSAGPRAGHFWDVYGDDYLTPEIALLALSRAEAPPAPDISHLEATIGALTEARDWQWAKKDEAEAALRALQAKFDQLQDELTRARATAAESASGAWGQMRAMARRVLVRHVEAGGATDPVCASPDGEPITTAQMIDRLDIGEDVSAFLDSLTGAALRLMRAELRTAKPAPERQG